MRKIHFVLFALFLATIGTAKAYAHNSFGFNLNIGGGGYYYAPPPVYYTPPPPVYYASPRVYYQPRPAYQGYFGPGAYIRHDGRRYYDNGYRGWRGYRGRHDDDND